MSTDGRTAALATAAGLLVVLVAALVVTTPWRALPGRVRAGHASDGSGTADFTAGERERGKRFHRAAAVPSYSGLGAGLLVAVLFGLTPLGSGLIGLAAQPLGGGWAWQATVGAVAFVLVTQVAGLPFGIWSESLLRVHGLSVQTWRGWGLDRLKGLLLGAALLLLLLPAAYALVHRFPAYWWVVAAVVAALLTVLLSFVFPLVVEPLFFRFRPLDSGPVADELLEMARRDGLPVRGVLVADASRRTTALNAYVSGFGRTRRIVVYDTLLSTASPAEVRLVVAHELGHAKRADVLRGALVGALAAALGVVLVALALTSQTLLRWAHAGGPGDPRSLGLALLVLSLLGVLAGPALNLVSRRVEAEADLHSLDLTRDTESFARSERRLALTNLADLEPPAFAYAMFASHPTVPQRIALAREWARYTGLAPPGPLAAAPPRAGAAASGAAGAVALEGSG
jgi:STE24 endopeptidase